MATPPEGPRRFNPYALLFCAAFLYVFIHSYATFQPILLAFLLVFLIALALNPAVAFLRKKLGGRSLATALIIFVFLAIAGLTGWGIYRPLKESTTQFAQRLPQYWERIQKPLMKFQQKAAVSEQKIKQQVTTEIIEEDAKTNGTDVSTITNAVVNQPPERVEAPANVKQQSQEGGSGGFVQSGLSSALSGVAGTFKTLATNAFGFLMIAVTVFVGTIFTLLNPRPIIAFTFGLVPEVHHEKAERIAIRIIDMIPRWAFATLLGMATIGSLVFVAMWLVLGFQDALVLGLIAFVLEAVPYVGPILAVLPAFLLAFGKGGLAPMWVLIAYAIIQAIENNLVAPLIMAGRLKLHPLAVLFAILLCAVTFGVLGAILAAPLVVIFSIFHDELYRPRFLPNVSDEQLEAMAGKVLNKESRARRITSVSKQS